MVGGVVGARQQTKYNKFNDRTKPNCNNNTRHPPNVATPQPCSCDLVRLVAVVVVVRLDTGQLIQHCFGTAPRSDKIQHQSTPEVFRNL